MRTFTPDELKEVIELHGKWLRSEKGGKKADLSGSNLSYSDLSGSNLSGSNLSGSNLSGSNLRCSNLSYSNLSYSDLSYSDLSGSNLSGSNLSSSNLRCSDLSYSNLSYSDLSYSDLSGSNLSGSNLSYSNLSYSNLSYSDLSYSDLSGSNLSGSNLSGSNLNSQQGFMQDNFAHDRRGFIVYKTFNSQYPAPADWRIEPGAIIEEVCNPDRCTDCGSGVNVATLEWVKRNGGVGDIWKCRIAWKDAPGIIVPFGSDGKIRAERVELIEVVPR